MKKLQSFPLFKTRKRMVTAGIIVLVVGFFFFRNTLSSDTKPQYQTAIAEKGTLIVSVSASGTVVSAGSANITTQASGIVKNVFVKNGDSVTLGQKIAEITLDTDSNQKQAAAYSSYLSAGTTLKAAQAKMNSLQSALFKANQAFVTDRGVSNPSDSQKTDPKYVQEQADWLQAEADYKNQSDVVNQAQAAVTSTWLAYQQVSSIITAPTSGVITNLTISPGSSITATTSSSSTTTNASQTIGTIANDAGILQASVNLSEIDATKVNVGQKVTITMDAFPNKTFTGKVTTINTNGVVSSGVTTYPATITYDVKEGNVYPNMGVNAKIITKVKDNVFLVPSTAVQTQNGQTTVRVLQNGQIQQVTVEIGDSSDTQTEIVSGIKEGDVIVTTVMRQTAGSQTSPFGGNGFGGLRGGGFGGGFVGGNRGR